MTDELKPVNCGCGGEAKVEEWVGRWYVRCKNSNCLISTKNCDTEAEAITAWNRAMSGSAEEKLKAFWDGMSAEMKEERKKGKWIKHENPTLGQCLKIVYECSVCHTGVGCEYFVRRSFCPNCGADMRGE